jgi:hypothetical protein
LSDDPAEALQQLTDLAGANAVIRVDSFEGQQLPPKAQIKSIHVTRDQFAAETPQPGSTFVDVITQPGIGPIRGTATASFRDGGLSAVSPFTGTKGPEQIRNYAANIGGAWLKDKSNFSLAINGRNEYNTPLLNAALPDGTLSETLSVRQPHTLAVVNGLLDYALTRDQTLRLGYSQNMDNFDNLGVGGFNLPERGFSLDARNYTFRALEAGPIGRRAFINTRLTASWFDQTTHSNIESPAIVVQDAFTSGGAQQAGGQHGRQVQIATDIDFIQGIHSWRTGAIIYDNHYRQDDTYNYLGTYTFSSLAAYQAGLPLLYTRQIGDPTAVYGTTYGGVYLQDDMRVRRGLTLSLGVRYSFFDIGDDHLNLQPRIGMTWAPFKSGKTTIRSSFGTFPSSPSPYIIGQTTRFDGVRQRELDITNPSFPDPGSTGVVPLTNKYPIGRYELERDIRYSGGVDQRFTPQFGVNVLYNYYHGTHLQRGANLNAPVNGVRPDLAFANIISVVSDGEIIRHEFYLNFTASLFTPSAAANRARFNWRRIALNGGYSFIRARRDVMGPFDVPPSGTLATEWGNGPADNPYRVNLNVTSTQLKNFTANFTLNASDGTPYNWTTGLDDNQDGLLNDRPAGVGIWTLRTAPQWTLNSRFTYTVPLSTAAPAPGGPEQPARYRVGVFVNVINLTDHANYGGYSGVQTSPFFQQPTLVINPRKVDVGLNISF